MTIFLLLNWVKDEGQLLELPNCSFAAHFSFEEAQRHHRCECRHAGNEGGEPADDEGEESDHPGAVPLAPLPPAPLDCCRPAALPAAVWHQRCECPGLDIIPLLALRKRNRNITFPDMLGTHSHAVSH